MPTKYFIPTKKKNNPEVSRKVMRPYKDIDTNTLNGMINATRKALRFANQLNLTTEEQGELNKMLNLLLEELDLR